MFLFYHLQEYAFTGKTSDFNNNLSGFVYFKSRLFKLPGTGHGLSLKVYKVKNM